MRLLFFGSPDFAVPTLQRLISLGHAPVAVLSQPDRPAGRGLKLTPPAVKVAAQAAGLTVLQPEKLDDATLQQLQTLKPDLAVVIAYGKILKPAWLNLPQFGCVNLHASLLPHLRGAAPIQRALMLGDRTSGVSLQVMEQGLDTGPVVLSQTLSISQEMNGQELHDQLSALSADVIEQFFKMWGGRTAPVGTPQDEGRASYAAKITAEDRLLLWDRPTDVIFNRIRAFAPSPGARTHTPDGPFQILKARIAPLAESRPLVRATPGTIAVEGERAWVRTGSSDSCLELLIIKPAGSSALQLSAYLRGHRLPLAFSQPS